MLMPLPRLLPTVTFLGLYQLVVLSSMVLYNSITLLLVEISLHQVGNNWFDALHSSLQALGFSQSQHDPCLFIRKDCLILVYVDDCLIFGRSDDVLDTVISNLQKDFVLTSQGSVGAYLGIDICCTPDGHLELCQPGLINKIITACGLQDQSSSWYTPSTMILTADTSS
jgi:hypothetical protein